jgi:four helix bundle protein
MLDNNADWMFEEGNNYLMLNDISAYKISFSLSNFVWGLIINWNYFEKDTVGKQFVRAVDSISANLAEGFGRYGKKDKIHFYRYSFGSLKESQDWNEKARIRNLLTPEEYKHISEELAKLPREINYLIKFTDEKLKF